MVSFSFGFNKMARKTCWFPFDFLLKANQKRPVMFKYLCLLRISFWGKSHEESTEVWVARLSSDPQNFAAVRPWVNKNNAEWASVPFLPLTGRPISQFPSDRQWSGGFWLWSSGPFWWIPRTLSIKGTPIKARHLLDLFYLKKTQTLNMWVFLLVSPFIPLKTTNNNNQVPSQQKKKKRSEPG